MPVTVNINNLSLCHKGSNGISMATIPDVCKTPAPPAGPVPIPYPNIAMSSDLMKGTTTVKADGGNMCAISGSEFFKSTGDEPGSVGGVMSNVFIKEATWITYSFDVKFEGKGACRLTDKMFHNHQNTVNMGGLLQAILVMLGLSWDVDSLLKILCDKDKDVVKKAGTIKVLAVDPLVFDDPIYQGGKWTTKEFHAGGTQSPGKIQITRNMSPKDAATVLYHELIHADQPDTMSWPEKEYDAYKRTEEWSIERGLPSQHPEFRTSGPMPPGASGPGRPVVDEAAIKRKVDEWYPFTPPSTSGAPTPPQVVGKSADGKEVIVEDSSGNQSTRPVKEGDTFAAAKPRNPTNEEEIPPTDFKCP
jgi:hypothetical protein